MFSDTVKTSGTEFLAPWQLRPISYDVSFTSVEKNRVPRSAILQHFFSLQHKYKCADFTLMLQKLTTVSCAMHGGTFNVRKTMNRNSASIFTAEAYSIPVVANHILVT